MKSERHWVGTWTTAPAPAEGRERDLPRRRLDPGARSDAVVDFDRTLRDPAHPARMLPIYDCGDHLHPSDLGYNAMGDAIDLALFDRRAIFETRKAVDPSGVLDHPPAASPNFASRVLIRSFTPLARAAAP
jgi:hypothetical protein